MSVLNTLKIGGRTAFVALVLGGAALTAMPAQAAGFSFNFGNGFEHNGVMLQFGNGHFRNNYCLSNSEIRSQLSRNGYRDVKIVKTQSRQRVVAVGRKGQSWYQLTVNSCSGAVDVQKIRRSSNGSFSFGGGSGYDGNNGPYHGDHRGDHGYDNGHNNGFDNGSGFSMSFGN